MGETLYYVVLVAAIPFGYFVVRLGSSLLLFDLPFTRRLGRRGIHRRPGRASGITLLVSTILLLLLGGAVAALMLLAKREEPVLTMMLGAMYAMFWKNPGRNVTSKTLRRYIRRNRRQLDPEALAVYVASCTGDPALVELTGSLMGYPADPEWIRQLMSESKEHRVANGRASGTFPRDGEVLPVARGLTWTRSLGEIQEMERGFPPRNG